MTGTMISENSTITVVPTDIVSEPETQTTEIAATVTTQTKYSLLLIGNIEYKMKK